MKKHWVNPNCQNSEPTKRTVSISAYDVRFWGLSWSLLPTLISDVINGRSLMKTVPHICFENGNKLKMPSEITPLLPLLQFSGSKKLSL